MKKKPTYQIKYSYTTGDSFSSEDREDILEYGWNNIEKAQDALLRIKEHYKWYESKEYPRLNKAMKPPKWWKVKFEVSDLAHHLINLKLDNGKEVQFPCPWCGYFESLHSVEIILKNEENKYVFD
jgi:hypothetical protein